MTIYQLLITKSDCPVDLFLFLRVVDLHCDQYLGRSVVSVKRIKVLLNQPEFHAILFVLGLILFSYPLLIMSKEGHPTSVYLSLFLPWGVMILLLFLTTRSYGVAESDLNQDDEDGGRSDA